MPSQFQFNSPPPFGPMPGNDVGAPVPPAPAPGGVNGIPGAMGVPMSPFPPMPPGPADMKYTTETQADGTVLLRVQNPDGTPGPVVQIVKPPTQKQGKQ